MRANFINQELVELSRLVGLGDFSQCFPRLMTILPEIEIMAAGELRDAFIVNIAAILVDLGAMQPSIAAAEQGLRVYEQYRESVVKVIGEAEYYYNLSNAKVNFIGGVDPAEVTFKSIEKLIEVKSLLWKSIKYHKREGEQVPPQALVNLANILKRQFRLSESLHFYDQVVGVGLDIPQAWINRSETLMLLNQVSGSYTLKMMHEIKRGYEQALLSQEIPAPWRAYYQSQVGLHEEKIKGKCLDLGAESAGDSVDQHESYLEFEALSDIRKFTLTNHLSLSEHGLYCSCAGSSRDNLTILMRSGVYGDFIPSMEMVLNRLRSEFSLARRFYYEYLYEKIDEGDDHESCYSELYNGELLGVDIEKLRTAFRICFGVLDKIAAAVCDLYKVHPESKMVYFQSFWQLDSGGRREIFEKIKNPGLLSLYSLASDLNDRKDGELAFFKQWRNDLEHKFIVIYESKVQEDFYDSYKVSGDVIKVSESEFVDNLRQLLQLTRSAIFSFVFCVREKGVQGKSDDAMYFPRVINRKDYF